MRALAVTLLALVACTSSIPRDCPQPSARVFFHSGVVLSVEVADTPATWGRGLMRRRRLGADRGMLFVFRSPTRSPFWMKDTLIPLSVAFYDERGVIIAIREMSPCRSSPCRLYRSPKPYVGAIEANRGYFERHDIRVGDRARARIAVACQ